MSCTLVASTLGATGPRSIYHAFHPQAGLLDLCFFFNKRSPRTPTTVMSYLRLRDWGMQAMEGSERPQRAQSCLAM